MKSCPCLLYTSDAADERSSVDLGGRRIIKKKTNYHKHRKENSDKKKTQYEQYILVTQSLQQTAGMLTKK